MNFPYKIGDEFRGFDDYNREWITIITDINNEVVYSKFRWSDWDEGKWNNTVESLKQFTNFYTPNKLVKKCYLDDSLFESE